MLCGSGLKSVYLGYQSIKSGEANIVVSGGQESMSLAPHAVHLRSGVKLGNTNLVDTMVNDGLTDAFYDIHMGLTAENISKRYNLTRQAQDEFAATSQQRAELAQIHGYFKEEIVPVPIIERNGTTLFERDEFIKANTTVEGLAKLRPCFVKQGTVTAGNASGINDSAAAVLLMSQTEVKKRSVKPLAKIVAFGQGGVEPDVMGLGASVAVDAVVINLEFFFVKNLFKKSMFFQLKKAGWTKEEVDLYELNEAFAAVSLAVNKELGVDPAKVNIHGGAIALGHPIGASGELNFHTMLTKYKY